MPERGVLSASDEAWVLAVRRAEVIGPLAKAGAVKSIELVYDEAGDDGRIRYEEGDADWANGPRWRDRLRYQDRSVGGPADCPPISAHAPGVHSHRPA